MFIVFARADPENYVPSNFAPFFYLFLVVGIDASLGWQTGCAVNPSNIHALTKFKINLVGDLGPRVFSWMAGYGTEVWSAGNTYFWVSNLSIKLTKDPNRLGGLTGALLYDLFIYTGNSPINKLIFGHTPLGGFTADISCELEDSKAVFESCINLHISSLII